MKNKAVFFRRISFALSIGLLAVSLTQKCYCIDRFTCGDSVIAFFLGFLGLMGLASGCIGSVCWLANPALILSWIFFKNNRRLSLIFSSIAAALSFLFLLTGSEWSPETGGCRSVESFRAGYWLWLFSAVTILASNLILKRNASQAAKS